jgi:uncharacterized protein YbjT (DUF2867 family)
VTNPVLVTGASGTVGRHVVRTLLEAGVPVRRAVRGAGGDGDPPGAGASGPAADAVRFDFSDPRTWPQAYDGVRSMFLLRPPAVSNVRRDLLPAVAAARVAGVEHVVFLSLQGAERNRVVPHATVESWLRGSGLDWTFVRPSFFLQNLSTTHAVDIRERDEILVPAGNGRTAFVDALDVAQVAAAALLDRERYAGSALTPTGDEALGYEQVAQVLSQVLGRPVRYARPGIARYARHARRELGMPWGMVAVTAAIYTTARLGLAAGLTGDVRTVLGRAPTGVRAFAERERSAWERPGRGAAPA